MDVDEKVNDLINVFSVYGYNTITRCDEFNLKKTLDICTKVVHEILTVTDDYNYWSEVLEKLEKYEI